MRSNEVFSRMSPERAQGFLEELVKTAPQAALLVLNAVAEEVLASYFLDQHKHLLIELLDALGLKHEEGGLEQDSPPCPNKQALQKTVSEFLKGDEPDRRKLLLESFAAQSAVDWPDLESLL